MVAGFLNKIMLLPDHLGLAGFNGLSLFNASIRKHQPHTAVPLTDPKKPRGSPEERAATSQICLADNSQNADLLGDRILQNDGSPT
jgi:hypothetical protein